MMENKNSIAGFKELYTKSFPENPLLAFSKFECRASLAVATVVTIVMYFVYATNTGLATTLVLQNLALYIGAALLGMLGFLVGGLAIISGTISNKVAHTINVAGKFDSLLAIMFSFYYEGAVIGVLIFLYLFAYLIVSIGGSYVVPVLLIISFVLSYGLCFAVCFAVSLLGTCINMFIINYNFTVGQVCIEEEMEQYFNSLRVDALTYIVSNKKIVDPKEFIEALKLCIAKDCPERLREAMFKKMCTYYSIEEKIN